MTNCNNGLHVHLHSFFLPVLPVLLLSLLAPALLQGQSVSDHFTGRYSFERLDVAHQMEDFRPPLKETASLPISGQLLLSFEDRILSRTWDIERAAFRYGVYDLQGTQLWTWPLPAETSVVQYSPSYSQDHLLLGGAGNGVAMFRASTGELLWSDAGIGWTTGRDPIVSGEVAFYHGSDGIKAVRAETGELIWSLETATAAAPLALSGAQLFASLADGRIVSIDAGNGEIIWTTKLFPGTDLMATEGRVFLLEEAVEPDVGYPPDPARMAVLDARKGAILWQGQDQLADSIALSRGRLFLFRRGRERIFGGGCYPCLQSRVPDTGEINWDVGYFPSAALYAYSITDSVIVNGTIFTASSRGLFGWDVSSGRALWVDTDIAGGKLSASQGRLLVSTGHSIEVYEPDRRLYFPHLADGDGQSTLLVLSNPGGDAAAAVVHFLDENGGPMSLRVTGHDESPAIALSIPAGGSQALETADAGDLHVGWIRVETDRHLKGSSIFRYRRGDERFEAGVASAEASDRHYSYLTRKDGFETAIALVNPFQRDVEVDVSVFSEGSTRPERERSVTLGPGVHQAFFVTDNGLPSTFTGHVIAVSYGNLPFLMTVLRTRDGLQMSSYP